MGTTRSPEPPTEVTLPPDEELARLKLSPEVAWYLLSRGYDLAELRPPLVKTPEPRDVPGAAFDAHRVDHIIKAFRRLRHTKGEWAGHTLEPACWQVAYILAPVFGWVRPRRRATRGAPVRWVRIIRKLYCDVPRKNGKSTLLGGIGIYLTAGDGEQGAEVVCAATTINQARYVFDPVKQLAASAPDLSKHVIPRNSRIIHPASGSYMTVVSSVAEAMHGGNLHGGIVDELHIHRTPDLVDAIETGTGSRTQPLVAIITTADDGRPDTVYAKKRGYIEKLALLVFEDETQYGVVFAAGENADPFEEETWAAANPNYPVSPTAEYMEAEANRAKNSPADLSSFLRLHLGIRTRQHTAFLALPDWDASAGEVDLASLYGREAVGGLDLASVEDITALCWVLPDEEGFDVLWRFWLPEDRAGALAQRTAKSSEAWVRDGYLTLTEGNVIDNSFIVAQVLADAERFKVRSIGYDRWGANDVVRRLTEEGLNCVPVGQGFQSMSQPMKEILRAVKQRTYRHGGNPVMRWMVSNLAVKMDPAGNVKPAKDTSGDKIDGISAAATAMRELLDIEATEQLPPADIF